ncbi:glycosyl hydrolase 53 family protein [Glycomyces sp. TRM65418]|uniref:glycosyl hydrolase 53 family protein n=1 Tax=Glycomyces sp. TRM65418 TaxID=2867006 RepID=UPI001CE5C1B5|nr:glycosyl hydrolase 53 family protein [Glycomyces sp. TRM65418]MCC3765829.1 glycosyl hydrolase 53 family protein [Glycomyces sp. TRM65418]QZD55415.1 glycosyl hydrolase 53 family protein [Glycomyces sp. TRM65418]
MRIPNNRTGPAPERGERLRRATASGAAALVLAGTGVLGSAAPASALYGEAEIQPVESNLAAKYWVEATAASGDATAALAIDQDPDTAWLATETGPGQWLQLDLGGAYDNVRKVHVAFPDPGAVYQYVVEASPDGEEWEVIADRSATATPGLGGVDPFTRPGTRYVRVTVTGASPGAAVGVSELMVFNYLRDDLVLGADLSWMDDQRNREYWVHPQEEDRGAGPFLLDVMQDRGLEYTRLRVFNEPRNESTGNPNTIPYQGPERTLTSAQWVAERGLGLGIDFHYADSWADPGKQPKPRAWAELEFPELTDAVYDYTYDYVSQLVAQGTVPDKVAVGNEIANGFMWGSEAVGAPATEAVHAGANPPYFRDQADVYQSQPGGGILWQYRHSEDPEERQLYLDSWDRFTTLLAAGIAAVRDASPESEVELHSVVGRISGMDKAGEFWHQLTTRLNAKGQDFDVLGLSYYPEHHGTLERMEQNLHTLATTYPQYKLEIAETSYPATGGGTQPNSTFPRTVQGQADAVQHVFQMVNDVIDNQGVGTLTWEPASYQAMFRSVPGMTNTSEPNASIDVYNKSRAEHVLEDTVYTAVKTGETPALPDSVDVLTTADGSVNAVPVEWDEAPSDATDAAGELTVSGTTEYGEVTAVVHVVDEFASPECDTVVSGAHYGPLSVETGTTCLAEGARVFGPVNVAEGTGLVADGARITGPVAADGADVVVLCGTHVSGPVSLTGSASVTLGDPVLDCAPNRVSGPVTVTGTTWWNVIAGNDISGPLSCSGSEAAPVNNGSANAVKGPKSGQCSGL